MTNSNSEAFIPPSQEVVDHEFREYVEQEFPADSREQINSPMYQATRALSEFDDISERLSAPLGAALNELRLEEEFAAPIEDLLMASEGDDEINTIELIRRFGDNFRKLDEEITAQMEEGEWTDELIAAVLVFTAYIDGMNEPEDKVVTLRGVSGIFEELNNLVNPFDAEVIREHLDNLIWRATANTYAITQHRDNVMAGLPKLDLPDIDLPNQQD